MRFLKGTLLLGTLLLASSALAAPDCARLAATGAFEIERTTTVDRAGTRKVTTYVQRTERQADGSYNIVYAVDGKPVRNHFLTDFHSVSVETGTFKTVSSYDPMPIGNLFEPGKILKTTRYMVVAGGKGSAAEQEIRIGEKKSVTVAGCAFEAYDVSIELRNQDPAIKPQVMRTRGDYIPALHLAISARTVAYSDAAGTIEDAISVITSGEIKAD